VTAERTAPRPAPVGPAPCTCALCRALIQAAAAAEQAHRERRKMLTIVTTDRRDPAA